MIAKSQPVGIGRDVVPVPNQTPAAPSDEGVRWLALLIRQGLLLIVAGIEARYRLGKHAEKHPHP